MNTSCWKSTSLSKRLRRNGDTDSVDRISELPDTVLGHILSFLPTKEAVATHILSKSWSFVWAASLSNLDFRYPESRSHNSNDFVNFVDHVLILHKDVCLNRLSLTLETDSVPSNVGGRIHSWICSAVDRNVRELFVCAKEFELPILTQRVMFGFSEGLRSLELNCRSWISSEIVVSLPSLESLRLSSIDLRRENVDSFNNFFAGCPVLNYLFMDMYMDNLSDNVCKFALSSVSLRRLEVYVHNRCPTSNGPISLMGLYTPSLEYIKLVDQVSLILLLPSSLVSLVEADIQLASFRAFDEIRLVCFDYLVKAFRDFDCVKTLTLSAHVVRALSRARLKIRTEFKRLTTLEVMIDRNHWSSLQDLIKLSDNLEVLTIKKDRDACMEDLNNKSNWEKLGLIPRCLSNSLRTVSFGDYDGSHDEVEMVSYILKHGGVLQVMKICFDESITDLETKVEIVKKISEFPRKSRVCKLEWQ